MSEIYLMITAIVLFVMIFKGFLTLHRVITQLIEKQMEEFRDIAASLAEDPRTPYLGMEVVFIMSDLAVKENSWQFFWWYIKKISGFDKASEETIRRNEDYYNIIVSNAPGPIRKRIEEITRLATLAMLCRNPLFWAVAFFLAIKDWSFNLFNKHVLESRAVSMFVPGFRAFAMGRAI